MGALNRDRLKSRAEPPPRDLMKEPTSASLFAYHLPEELGELGALITRSFEAGSRASVQRSRINAAQQTRLCCSSTVSGKSPLIVPDQGASSSSSYEMFAYAAGNRIDRQFVIRQRVLALTNRQLLTREHPPRFSPGFQLNQINSVNFNLAIGDQRVWRF